ncbi:endonuclease domain-containing protein [Streptomyces sp. NPDC051555]|uniref:endonuclease domain-containing protein n=1 Tax=Streptomyces sp. NPDC051555 TaxID=3365657 RepID=UPI0037AFE18F
MPELAVPGRAGGRITLRAADALWADLTADSAVPTASEVFARPAARGRAGYALLGCRVVAMIEASDGRWSVPEAEVRSAAAEMNAVELDGRDLVRIGPFRGVPRQEPDGGTSLRWRARIMWELQQPCSPTESGAPERAARNEGGGRSCQLAGIDWRRMLVEKSHDRAVRTWWLPRALVRLLDAAEHAETRWLHAERTRRTGAAVTEPPSPRRGPRSTGDPQATGHDRPTAPSRPYEGELEGHLYAVLSRKAGTARKVAGWACSVCRTAPAAVLDHCHEHGYVRAPVCQSCNTHERPDHLYSNDVRVADHYTRLFDTHAADWLRHWHRCPGCRTRSTLPLPHLAAWTAHTACRSLRPTHIAARGRRPCGVLRAYWTGSHRAPRSCLLTVAVDFCPSGEHRVLARMPYREAVERFGTWLAETAPAVAAAAGPERLDDLPIRSRPVVVDTGGEGLALF